MAAIAGYGGSVLITSSPSVALTNEAMSTTDLTTYTISNSAHRYLDTNTALVVQTSPDGTTWTTVTTGFTVQYVGGQVVFTSAQPTGTQCRVASGAYYAYSTLSQCKSWDIQGQVAMLENTTLSGYGGAHAKTYQPGLVEATGKVQRFFVDSTLFSILTTRTLLVFSGLTGRTAGERYEGYAYLKQQDTKDAVAALITEDLDIEFTGKLYYFAS